MVHELRNDTDWVNLKRSFVRAPQIIKQKLNTGDQLLSDQEFELLNDKFTRVESLLKTLESEVTKSTLLIKLFIQHSIGIYEALKNVFEPNLVSEQAGIPVCEMFQACVTFIQKINQIKAKTQPNLDLMLSNVKDPITRLLSVCKNIKRNIREREFAFLDVNKYKGHVEMLRTKKKTTLTLKQEQNLIKYEKNLELSKIKFERINDQFKLDFPTFFEIVHQFIETLHTIFYFLQLTVQYQLLSLNEFPDAIFRLRSKEAEMDPFSFGKHLTDNYHKVHNIAMEELDQLQITKGALEISVKLLSEHAVRADLESDVPDSISTAVTYCILKYPFKAEQEGDLSFQKGDKIRILDQRLNSDWWKGELDGSIGIFPKNYVII
jgi:hypothetical protein